MKSFGSDNHSGVHPLVMQVLEEVNSRHAIAYGDDPWTANAELKFKEVFGQNTTSFFSFNGTAANVLSMEALLKPYEGVVCCDTSHINNDECGAPERIAHCKLLQTPHKDGKLDVKEVEKYLQHKGFEHHVQAKMISITQSSELGTLYSLQEIQEIADFAHAHHMYLHIDGARLSNAAAALNCSLRATSFDVGADILSFGGTKNAMMFGEAVVFANADLSIDFKYKRKQLMQLPSKMRFVSAQFLAYLEDEQWRKTAAHANRMASLLADQVRQIQGVYLSRDPAVNAVFARLPRTVIDKLQEDYFFYVWDELSNEVRWMCSWDTSEEDILNFAKAIKEAF